jgi:predicted dehydrogenase
VIGAGNISRFHLQAWTNCGNVSVAAIADPDIARATAQAERFGPGIRVHASAEAMLAEGGLDAVDILSPRETHAAMVRAAAAAGLPALCQKPLTNELAQSRALAREVDGRIRLMVNENSRFRPQYRQIGAWIAAGCVGEVCQVRDTVVSSGLLPPSPGAVPPDIALQPFVRTERRLLVAEVLIHQIDTLRSLLGPLRLLSAHLRRVSGDVAGEDVATLVMETDGHCPVVLEGNRSAPGMPPVPDEELVILGTKGTIVLHGLELSLLGARPARLHYERIATIQAGFDFAARHFLSCLESGEPFTTGPDDNLKTLELVEAAYDMAR